MEWLDGDSQKKSLPLPKLIGRKVTLVNLKAGMKQFEGQTGTVVSGVYSSEHKCHIWDVNLDKPHLGVHSIVVSVFGLRGIPSTEIKAQKGRRKPDIGERPYGMPLSNGVIIMFSDTDYLPFVTKNIHTFIPKPDTDGCVRYWGVMPQHPDLRWTTPCLAVLLNRRIDFPKYGYDASPKTPGSPEEQFVKMLIKKKMREIKEARNMSSRFDSMLYTIRISLDNVNPPVYRIFTVTGGIRLHTLMDKILQPVMGWKRSYHCSILMDLQDGAIYGQENPNGVDHIFKYVHGFLWIDDTKVSLSDISSSTSKKFAWIYDLGVRMEHTLSILSIDNALEVGQRHVRCIDGVGACPPEDGDGLEENHPSLNYWHVLPSPKNNACPGESISCNSKKGKKHSKPKNRKTIDGVQDILFMDLNGNMVYQQSIKPGGVLRDSRHPHHNKSHTAALMASKKSRSDLSATKFNWLDFDLEVTNARLEEALHLRQSMGGCGYGCPCCEDALERPVKDPASLDLCAFCGTHGANKKCSGCQIVRYCSVECQKGDWKCHKIQCKEYCRQKQNLSA